MCPNELVWQIRLLLVSLFSSEGSISAVGESFISRYEFFFKLSLNMQEAFIYVQVTRQVMSTPRNELLLRVTHTGTVSSKRGPTALGQEW